MAGKQVPYHGGRAAMRAEALARECERQADRCRRYAEEVAGPVTAAVFRSLAYAYDSQAQELEASIAPAIDPERDNFLSELLNVHERAQHDPADKRRRREDHKDKSEQWRPGKVDEATPASPSDASEEEGSTAHEEPHVDEPGKQPG